MCRLFAMLSLKVSDASKYLIEDECSLYAQSKGDPRRLQGDGWGIGFYKNGCPVIVKSEKPVYMERERFFHTVQQARSRIILAHIRRASNPRGLPREKIISEANSQPFTYQNYIFVHNGTITIPDEAAEALGDWRYKIEGFNDSEVYFWFLMKELDEGRSISSALRNFRAILIDLWEEACRKYPEKRYPYIGLNSIVSDGENLYAYCSYEEDRALGRSLCFGDQPVFEMSYIFDDKKLVVASEKTNKTEEWRPLRSGELLIGKVVGDKIDVEIKRIG